MKALFKYAFLTGLYIRGAVFAVIFLMDAVFITLGSLGLLPFAAHVTAVSLGGVAVIIMKVANIGGDIYLARRLFSAPDAYLYALTPVPRRKILLSWVVTMAAMDLFSMLVVIVGEMWLSFNLAGGGIWQIVWNFLHRNTLHLLYGFWLILLMIAAYFLVMMVIMFCAAAKKSFFFTKRASGFLAFLLACACLYVVSLLQLILAPFSEVQRYGLLLIIVPTNSGVTFPLLIVLTLLEAAALFILGSKLIERKINI